MNSRLCFLSGSFSTGKSSVISLWDFLSEDMSSQMIVSLLIPFTGTDTVFRSFKIMPRAEVLSLVSHQPVTNLCPRMPMLM